MDFNYSLLDVFRTSIGEVAVIGISDDFIPHKGDSFSTNHNLKWKIVGIGSNKIYQLSDSKYDLSNLKSVWDCVVTPIGHNEALAVTSKIIFDSK